MLGEDCYSFRMAIRSDSTRVYVDYGGSCGITMLFMVSSAEWHSNTNE